MKNSFLILFLLSTVGCNSVNKLLDRGEEESAPEEILTSSDPIGDAPEFNLSNAPLGHIKHVYHGALSNSNEVIIEGAPGDTVYVFIKDVGTWFLLGDDHIGTFYYERPGQSSIRYRNTYRGGMEYCVYLYTPNTEEL